MTDNLTFAIDYVLRGFPVFPLCWPDKFGQCACGRNHQDRFIGKVPLVEHGLKDATSTKQGCKEFWTRWPSASIGIVIPAGYFVLDVDADKDGYDSLAKLQNDLDIILPETWLILTGSGGQHYWYKTPKPIRNTTKLAGYEGLDIRGIGGYVVAPESLHRSGHKYEVSWVWNGNITEAPLPLIELCLKRQPIIIDSPTGINPISEGQRNDTLARDAGAMRRRGLSPGAIMAALMVNNQERCSPPLPESEVKQIAYSVGRYAPEVTTLGKPQYKDGLR